MTKTWLTAFGTLAALLLPEQQQGRHNERGGCQAAMRELDLCAVAACAQVLAASEAKAVERLVESVEDAVSSFEARSRPSTAPARPGCRVASRRGPAVRASTPAALWYAPRPCRRYAPRPCRPARSRADFTEGLALGEPSVCGVRAQDEPRVS